MADVETLERLRSPPALPEQPLEPLSLFSEEIHHSPKRAALWTPEQAYRRNLRAKAWRRIRRQVETLPDAERADVLTIWRGRAARRLYAGTPDGLALFLQKVL
uniref:Uncharacterized protein n=1 Tax=Acetobacter pasteurianus TaxID=438 RepID=I3W088_ACEPA|nr:hypothetical protein [Acetobacter pasteurianus]